MEHSLTVRVLDRGECGPARQSARAAFETTYAAFTGRHLPRADGDLWWPGTSPLEPAAAPVPSPPSRYAAISHRNWFRLRVGDARYNPQET